MEIHKFCVIVFIVPRLCYQSLVALVKENSTLTVYVHVHSIVCTCTTLLGRCTSTCMHAAGRWHTVLRWWEIIREIPCLPGNCI